MSTPHPAAAPLLDAARTLAHYQPVDDADLAWLLSSIHDLSSGESLLDHLSAAFYTWANDANGNLADGEAIVDQLGHADELLGPVGEALDRAREATGHWDADGSEQ